MLAAALSRGQRAEAHVRARSPLLFCVVAGAHLVHAQPVTYTVDVASILARHCVACHHTGGSMPQLPLDTYASARAATPRLLAPVAARTMPPWFADPNDSVA